MVQSTSGPLLCERRRSSRAARTAPVPAPAAGLMCFPVLQLPVEDDIDLSDVELDDLEKDEL